MTTRLAGRARARRRLTPEQVSALRARLGLPPDGPTPDMVKAWSAEENIEDSTPAEPSGRTTSTSGRARVEFLKCPNGSADGGAS